MLTKRSQFIVAAALAAVALAVPPAFAQGRGSSALPAGPGDPLAARQSQIDLLKQQLGGITGSGIQTSESNLRIVRGTGAGGARSWLGFALVRLLRGCYGVVTL